MTRMSLSLNFFLFKIHSNQNSLEPHLNQRSKNMSNNFSLQSTALPTEQWKDPSRHCSLQLKWLNIIQKENEAGRFSTATVTYVFYSNSRTDGLVYSYTVCVLTYSIVCNQQFFIGHMFKINVPLLEKKSLIIRPLTFSFSKGNHL